MRRLGAAAVERSASRGGGGAVNWARWLNVGGGGVRLRVMVEVAAAVVCVGGLRRQSVAAVGGGGRRRRPAAAVTKK